MAVMGLLSESRLVKIFEQVCQPGRLISHAERYSGAEVTYFNTLCPSLPTMISLVLHVSYPAIGDGPNAVTV